MHNRCFFVGRRTFPGTQQTKVVLALKHFFSYATVAGFPVLLSPSSSLPFVCSLTSSFTRCGEEKQRRTETSREMESGGSKRYDTLKSAGEIFQSTILAVYVGDGT